eukprot:CAMPEP_0117427756 /NCGR_PEP_ID=MMETSP0758-20121206/7563_1 /TAXON_ID=63605 /ORGANISM="Percolomonas cosmopolitus, Strain AE-1 (ATCC 50343)" /LENGTH=309 /DNA_ID=CAMNT_0005213629 /DNA_START=247 /DNA_END=1172 /DNA_ORIENTATION=-
MSSLTRKNKDKKNCILKLQELSKRIEGKLENRTDANYFLDCEIAFNHIKLAQNVYNRMRNDRTLAPKFETYQKNAKTLLNDTGDYIRSKAQVKLELNAKYHQIRAEFMKLQNKLQEYYSEALLYLAYRKVENIESGEQKMVAYDLIIAALIGDVYQFGEIIHHPILQALSGTKFEFLIQLLHIFHAGDIEKFTMMESTLENVPILKSNMNFLHKKLQIMSLLNLVFSKVPEQRVLTFAEIKSYTRVLDVELLLLKALSLKLIKGMIDEVQQTVYISWCQPKVLNRNELSGLRKKVSIWRQRVADAGAFV